MSFCSEEMEKKELPSEVFQLVPKSSVSGSYKGKSRLRSAEVFKHLKVSKGLELGFGFCSCQVLKRQLLMSAG